LLARELLSESGSVFVQISDENLHYIRNLIEEIFGRDNFCAQISFKKTSGQASNIVAGICDYLVWFAKDKNKVKSCLLYNLLGDEYKGTMFYPSAGNHWKPGHKGLPELENYIIRVT
jgi:adenine specific DNA methylase Mod